MLEEGEADEVCGGVGRGGGEGERSMDWYEEDEEGGVQGEAFLHADYLVRAMVVLRRR